MSNFWSWYIILLVVVMIVGCALLLITTGRYNPNGLKDDDEIDHGFDGIIELNKPLPQWWIWLFWLTIVFSIGYLILYPGLGNYQGVYNWSSSKQWQEEVDAAKEQYGPIFTAFANQPVEQLAKNPHAMEIAQRLFANHCATCHGSDARGMKGFPNLVEGTWTYGGTPEEIKQTIMHGRKAMMPSQMSALQNEKSLEQVMQFLLHTNNRKADADKAKDGEKIFKKVCAMCHGADAKGSKLVGAPNLTDNTWTHGGTNLGIEMSIRNGRQGEMPAHKNILGDEKVHLMTAYIYSISNKKESRSSE